MKIVYWIVSTLTLLLPMSVAALSPDATEGKQLFVICNSCHNEAQDPPLGPPMWGVQRRYQRNSLDNEDFIESIVSFVKNPTTETAIHDQALSQLGLMPPIVLPDEQLRKIASYLLEEKFPPPCKHWEIAVKRATARGDLAHAAKDSRQLDRFCK